MTIINKSPTPGPKTKLQRLHHRVRTQDYNIYFFPNHFEIKSKSFALISSSWCWKAPTQPPHPTLKHSPNVSQWTKSRNRTLISTSWNHWWSKNSPRANDPVKTSKNRDTSASMSQGPRPKPVHDQDSISVTKSKNRALISTSWCLKKNLKQR